MKRPSNNPITQGYSSKHPAYDFAGLNLPDEVMAGQNGEIIERVDEYTTNWENTGTLTTKDYGNYIKVRHDDGSYAIFAHLKKGSSYVVGTKVTAGQIIARIGNTGNSTGLHLHAEYRNASNVNMDVSFESEPMAVITQKELDIMRLRRDELYNLSRDANKKIEELTTKLQKEQTTSQGLREALAKQTQADSDLGNQILQVSHERDLLRSDLNATIDALGLEKDASVLDILSAIDNGTKPSDEIVKKYEADLSACYENLQKGKIKTLKEWLIYGWNLLRSKCKISSL